MPTTQEGGTSLPRLVDCFQAVSEGAVVKILIQQRRKRTRMNGDAVNGCQWLVHRHLLTASRRQPLKTTPSLATQINVKTSEKIIVKIEG